MHGRGEGTHQEGAAWVRVGLNHLVSVIWLRWAHMSTLQSRMQSLQSSMHNFFSEDTAWGQCCQKAVLLLVDPQIMLGWQFCQYRFRDCASIDQCLWRGHSMARGPMCTLCRVSSVKIYVKIMSTMFSTSCILHSAAKGKRFSCPMKWLSLSRRRRQGAASIIQSQSLIH